MADSTPAVLLALLLLAFPLPFTFAFNIGAHNFKHDILSLPQHPLNIIPAAGDSSPLECLEVVPPVVTPAAKAQTCSQVIMQHSFGNSYGKPFVGSYQPPICDFDHVIMNLTVEAAGRQFDRLAIMYLNDIEVWRTSTAEPSASGIIWSYSKDVTPFLSLWKQPQTVIFDLGNIVNDVYTAPFNATITLTFFNVNQTNELPPADIIIPLSARKSAAGESSAFKVPNNRAISNITIPKNVKRALFTISACGQMAEEFWWSNVPDSTKSTFGDDFELLAHSPFREVQLLIDGELAGVAWPFPVIFTGGVAPGFWRPVVGIDAFDLTEYEIDITPWVSYLSYGEDHSFEIRVMGLSDDGLGNAVLSTVGSYWVVTGKLFLWLDPKGPTGAGLAPEIWKPDLDVFITSGTGGADNSTLNYQVLVSRQFQSWNSIYTPSEGSKIVSWDQTLSYSNYGKLSDYGSVQSTSMMISGSEWTKRGYSGDWTFPFQRKFAFPLKVTSKFAQDPNSDGFSINADMDFSKNMRVLGSSIFISPVDTFTEDGPFDGWIMTNRQNGTASYFSDGRKSGSSGATEQHLALKGIKIHESSPQVALDYMEGVELYSRHVLAVNNTLVGDSETALGEISRIPEYESSDFAPVSIKNIVGGKVVKLAGL